jgi:PAS domain S-box-containing protein
MTDNQHNAYDDTHLAQQLIAFRQQLEREGVAVEIDQDAPLAEQLARLQDVVLHRLARYRERVAAGQQTEEALHRSRTLLAEAEQLSHTGAWEWDLSTSQWTFSDEWLEIHGAARRTLAPDELLAIAHPDDRARIEQAFQDVRLGVKSYELEHRIIRQDTGEERVVKSRGQFVRDAAGAIVRVYGFVQDITEQKRAEEALRESEERFRTLFANMTEGFALGEAICDDQGRSVNFRFLEINDAFLRQTGLPREVVGKPITEALPNLEPVWIERYTNVAMSGEPIRFTEYNTDTQRYYDVYCYRPAPGRFAILFRDVTHLRFTEEALRESEAKFRSIFEQAAVGIGRVRFEDARWIDVNDAFIRMVGYSREELLSTPWPQITYPEDIDIDLVPFRQMAAGELENYSVEKRFIHKQGHLVWARLTLSLVRDAQGQPAYEIAIIEDITDRKQAVETLRESEERLTLALDAAGLGTWDLDLTTDVAVRSLRHDQIWGYAKPQAEWGKARAMAQVPPEDHPRIVEAYARAFKTGVLHHENRVIWPDGSVHWIAADGRIQWDSEGRPARIIGVVADITDRKRAEAALRESEARFSAVANNMAQLAWITDETGWIVWYNKRWYDYTGTTFEEMQGWGWQKVHHPDHVQRVVEKFRHAIQTGTFWEDTFPLRGKDGQYRWFLSRAIPIRDEQGKVVRWFGTNTDITELRETQQQLQDLTTTLEQRVQERTAALESTNKELEAFSYSVSHDLRAPLRSIDGFSKILLEKYRSQVDETGRDYLQRVRNAAMRMGRLIDDMLNLSRIGRREMRRDTVNLSDLAAAVLTDLRGREPERQVLVEIQPEMLVNGDPGLLRIVMENLLGNAWKFTSKTEGARIEVGMRMQEGRRIYYVCDNGAGFDMSYADKLFSPFQRLHSEDEFPGTGIGLAVVQRIITRHGGHAWAEGAEGKGATIYFTLGESA